MLRIMNEDIIYNVFHLLKFLYGSRYFFLFSMRGWILFPFTPSFIFISIYHLSFFLVVHFSILCVLGRIKFGQRFLLSVQSDLHRLICLPVFCLSLSSFVLTVRSLNRHILYVQLPAKQMYANYKKKREGVFKFKVWLLAAIWDDNSILLMIRVYLIFLIIDVLVMWSLNYLLYTETDCNYVCMFIKAYPVFQNAYPVSRSLRICLRVDIRWKQKI